MGGTHHSSVKHHGCVPITICTGSLLFLRPFLIFFQAVADHPRHDQYNSDNAGQLRQRTI